MTNLDQLPPHGFTAERVSDQVGEHHRGARAGRGDHRGLRSFAVGTSVVDRSLSKGCRPRRPRSPAARAQAWPAWLRAGLPVPRGFVVCSSVFQSFLDQHGGGGLVARADARPRRARRARRWTPRRSQVHDAIVSRPLPDGSGRRSGQAYEDLGDDARGRRAIERGQRGWRRRELCRAAGNVPERSRGRGRRTLQVQACWASFFSPRAMFYRAQKGHALRHTHGGRRPGDGPADKSGVMFTVDPIRKRRDRLVIEAVLGLGEGIVSGEITPDHYVLDRETGALVEVFIAVQSIAVEYDPRQGRHASRRVARKRRERRPGPGRRPARECATDGASRGIVLRIAAGCRVVFRGNELLLLQSRPITTL